MRGVGAIVVSKGFKEVHAEFKNVRSEMANGFKEVRAEIEDLAVMTAKGFEEVDKKFVEVDSKFADVNASLQQVKYRLTMVEDNTLDLKLRMDVLSHNSKGIDELRNRMTIVEKKVGVK